MFKPILSNSAYGALTIVGDFPSGVAGSTYLKSLPIVGGRIPYGSIVVVSGAVPAGMALSIVSNRLQLAMLDGIDPRYQFIVGDQKQSIYLCNS